MNAILSHRQSSLALPIVLLLVSMISIQSGASLAKHLFPSVGAAGATTLRLVIGAILLAAAFRPWCMRIGPGQWRSLLAYGLSLGAMNLLFYQSLTTLPLGIAIALEFTGPLGVALVGTRRWRDAAWVALAVAGLWLLLPDVGGGHVDPSGAACALGAGLCWALYIVHGQRAGVEHGAQTVALGAFVGALVVLPFGIAQAGSAMLSPGLLPLALAVALLSTALPYSLEMVALTRIPTRSFGMLMSLEPVFGALSGALLLGERLTAMQWLAVVAIVAASGGVAATARAPIVEAGGGEG